MREMTQLTDLRARVLAVFRRAEAVGVDDAIDDVGFDALAREIFAYQLDQNAPFAAYCKKRGLDANNVAHWSEIPAVPTAGFREVELVCGDPAACQAVFRTSGTTRGTQRRGTHYIPDLSVYHGAVLPNFTARVMAGERMPILSIVPPAADLTDSSLAHMVDVVVERIGAEGSGWYASSAHGIDVVALDRSLREHEESGSPVCLVGTTLAFVHWLDGLEDKGARYRLPPGSRLMDTGGYKGERREVAPSIMRERYEAGLGIEPEYCVNEYGMTELCSQYYDASLQAVMSTAARAANAKRPAHKVAPPWLRTRVVHPETLAPVPTGKPGILQHFDLANMGSVVAVQTEDVGFAVDGGIILLGRASGAPPRGCSIALDMLLSAAQAR